MASRHEIHAYDYVNHPYEAVRNALLANPLAVFRQATAAAAARSEAAGAELHVKAGPLDIGAEVGIEVVSVTARRSPDDHPALELVLEWKATRHPALFPTMRATLSIYPLTPTETQLDFAGTYEPPLGFLGEAVDAIAMHGMAGVSVTRFVRDVGAFLRSRLAADHAA
jgi:hypothetical protein